MTHTQRIAHPQTVHSPHATSSSRLQMGLALLCVAAAMVGPFTSVPTLLLIFGMAVLYSVVHGGARYGWGRFFAFFVFTYLISNAFENLSIVTGFPFGHYHYTGPLKLFHVPAFIGVIYFGLGYVSWLVASVLLDRADEHLDLRRRRGLVNVFSLPMLSAAVMTMFDVGSDSMASTVDRAWVWERGGGFFGVPYTNYLGWWLVTYSFFQVFAWMLARAQTSQVPAAIVRPGPLSPAIVIYASLGVLSLATFIAATPGSATDGAGVAWDVVAMAETLMVVNVFSVMVIAFLAFVKIARGDVDDIDAHLRG